MPSDKLSSVVDLWKNLADRFVNSREEIEEVLLAVAKNKKDEEIIHLMVGTQIELLNVVY